MNNFQESGLKPEIISAITEMGFTEPTPVQAEILPLLQNLPESLVALAQTGTGKTAGFGLPLLHHIDPNASHVQALVLCPTRELCLQITDDFTKFKKNLDGIFVTPIYGGAPIYTQEKQLKKGSQVVVGTPGRVVDMIRRGALKLEKLQLFVLDEADEMLNMGFKEDLETIFKQTPKGKSTWLFSATMPPKVESIARKYMAEPLRISIGKRNEGALNVSHEYYMVSARDRFEALSRLLDFNPDMYGVVFCRTREETNAVAAKLNGLGYPAEAINGALSQQQRDKVMGRFRKKQITLLVATDVAARGIDVDDLTHVVNYSLPDDPEVYVHRSGRTGRAGKDGVCLSIIHGREKGRIREIERMLGKKFELKKVPGVEEIGKTAVLAQADELLAANLKGTSVASVLTEVFLKFEELSREDIIEQFVKYAYSNAVKSKSGGQDINFAAGKGNDRDVGPRAKNERGPKGNRRERDDDGKFTRMDINIGYKEHVNPAKLMGIINEAMNNSSINFGKIEIETNGSSIDVESQHAIQVAESLSGTQYGSKKLKVDLKAEPLGSVGRPGGKRSFKGGRPGGGKSGGGRPGSGGKKRSFKDKGKGRKKY